MSVAYRLRRNWTILRDLFTQTDVMNETLFEIKEWLWHNWWMKPRSWLLYGDKDFPSMITLETQTVCNRRCHYCPNSTAPMEFAQMTEETFKIIVARMKAFNFCGKVVLSSFSEPLLDPRLFDFIRHLKKEIPRCHPCIFTNGDYLDTAVCHRLILAGARYIHVTRHPPFKKDWDEKIERLRREFPKHIEFRGVLEGRPWLFNFAGTVKNVEGAREWTTCQSVKWNTTIHFNGDFPLCANLPLKKPVYGNLVEEDWMKIWWKPAFVAHRKQAKNAKPFLDVCVACYDRSPDAHLKPKNIDRLRKAKLMNPNARAVTTREMIPTLIEKQNANLQTQEKAAQAADTI